MKSMINSHLIVFVFVIVFMGLSIAQESGGGVYDMEFGVLSVDGVSLVIKGNGYVDVVKRITLGDKAAGVVISCPAEGLRVVGRNDAELNYTVRGVNNKKLLMFSGGAGDQVRICYSTSHLISKNGSVWTIRYSTSATPHHTLINLHFLPNTKIMPFSTEILFSPVADGLIIYPDSPMFSFDIDYETSQGEFEGLGLLNNSSIVLVLFVLSIPAVYLLMRWRGAAKVGAGDGVEEGGGEAVKVPKIMDSIRNTLDENERRIIEMLEFSGDEITQAYIYKSTGIPKSTLSELMNRLEKRNIVERRREGRTKWVRIKKWVFE